MAVGDFERRAAAAQDRAGLAEAAPPCIAFISANQRVGSWDQRDEHGEPVFRRVEHVCSIVMVVIETHVRQGKPNKAVLSQRDVSEFRRELIARPSANRPK